MKKQENHGPRKVINALQKCDLLCNLSEEKIHRIAGLCEEDIWPKKTCSISKNRIADCFHFILSGRLKMYQMDPESGREFTLFLLKENDAFDVIRLLNSTEHEVFYETIDKVHLLSLPVEAMLALQKEIPEINSNLLCYVARLLKSLEDYASNLTLADVPQRLARLFLANLNQKTRELEFIHDFSNEELANLIGTTRAVVNRHLQEFKAEGILSLGREKIQVINPQLLLQKA